MKFLGPSLPVMSALSTEYKREVSSVVSIYTNTHLFIIGMQFMSWDKDRTWIGPIKALLLQVILTHICTELDRLQLTPLMHQNIFPLTIAVYLGGQTAGSNR